MGRFGTSTIIRQAEKYYILPRPSGQGTHWSGTPCRLCRPKTECIHFDAIIKYHYQNPARVKQSLPNRTCVYISSYSKRSDGGYWSIARIAATRTSLELAGDIGKHSQSQRNYEQNIAEMTPEELSAIIDRWEGEKAAIAKDITPVW